MKITNLKIKYRRRLLLYSLVILLPGTFLSILAYRGIRENNIVAQWISDNNLARKGVYFTASIEDSIDMYLDAFIRSDIIQDGNSISLKPDSRAHQFINNGVVLSVAIQETDSLVKLLDQSTLIPPDRFLEEIDRIYKNVTTDVGQPGRSKPAFFSYFEDSLSVLLVSKLNRRYNVSLLLDIRELLHRNIGILEETWGFRNRIAWRLLDEHDNVLWIDPVFNSREDFFTINPNKLGAWALQLQELSKKSGQQFLFFGFIFVLSAMAIGVILTFRSLVKDYRLSQLKSDFVSNVSHELRSPLTSIRMMSERLANRRVKAEDRKQEYYNSMLAQSERLSHLVENILDFSRIDEGRKVYHFKTCNIINIAREVLDYMLLRYKEIGVEIKLTYSDDSPFAVVDYQSIHQVFYNLIDNAIKYSGNSKTIDVGLSNAGQMTKISVRDYGIGISKKEQRRIFDRFYRIDGADASEIKGSGIGLSIVNEIIKAHNGKIELESVLGKGSTFTIYLPVKQK
ncbi:sensor histidine kinase [Bacteroidota bacterium]